MIIEHPTECDIGDRGEGHCGTSGEPGIAARAGSADEEIAGRVADLFRRRAHARRIELVNVAEVTRDFRRHADAIVCPQHHPRSHSKTSHCVAGKPVTILLVDDDKVDAMAVKRSFQELRIDNLVVEAHNGIEALERLRGQNGHEQVPSPCLVLLDLNMPRMGGIEFLAELRRDPSLCRIVVFVMTTSAAEEDRKRAYDKNVAGYVLKHRPGQSFLDSIRMLQRYWRVIEFPD